MQHASIFGEPITFPPYHSTDIVIPLNPRTSLVSVQPYHYGHLEKLEIERLVAEVLVVGIIRLSASPFSSTMLFVRKKDGSWRFYVDY